MIAWDTLKLPISNSSDNKFGEISLTSERLNLCVICTGKTIHQIYGYSGLPVWSLLVLPGPLWAPSGHSINLPQPKHMHVRLICDSELGVNVKVNACLSQLALQQTVDLPKLYPAHCFVTAGIGSTPTTTLNWISERK